MQTKLLAATLAAVAVVAAIFLFKPSEPEKAPPPATKTQSGNAHPRMSGGSDSGTTAPERSGSAEATDPDTAEGLAEIDGFLKSYRKAADSEEKIDLLSSVRKLDLEDRPVVNDFLLNEIFDSDPEIRENARDALLEYGGKNAHRSLGDLLQARPDIPERKELENILDDLLLPTYSPADSRRKPRDSGGSSPSQPRKNQTNHQKQQS